MKWTKLGEKLFKALFGGGDMLTKEKIIIKKLKICQNEKEFIAICKGLELIGTIYSFPTLMALLADKPPRVIEHALQTTFDGIAFRYLSDESLPRNYFNSVFWESTWTGSKTEFLSLMMVLENLNQDTVNEYEMERLAMAFIKELKLDISPYQTYGELKLCAADWDIEKDVADLIEATQTDMLLEPLLEDNNIGLSSETDELLANQKNDYLLTRVKLFENFEANHYVLRKIACLNRTY
jgi:hypothetical protein